MFVIGFVRTGYLLAGNTIMFKIHHFEWFSIEQGQDNSGVMLSVTDLEVKKRGKEEGTPLLARGLEL